MLPKNPVMLLSFINMKLRDQYDSLESLCEDLGAEEKDVIQILEKIDYHYDRTTNQFK